MVDPTATSDIQELRRKARAQRELYLRESEHDVGKFVLGVSGARGFVRPECFEPFARQYDRSMAEPVFALQEGPPRLGKSELCFHHVGRRFYWRPRSKVAYMSYSAEIAHRKSRRIRELCAAAGVWVGSEKSHGDGFNEAKTVKFWQTRQGGFFVAGGREGAYVGEGFDLIIVDDPFKDRAMAESEVMREKVWDFYQGTARTRLEPGGSMFVMHQRWNDDDLIARILENEKKRPGPSRWHHTSLPAVLDYKEDKHGRIISGRSLWPQRYTLEDWAAIKLDVGEYNWWSQYQQNPRGRGRQMFKAPGRYEAHHADRVFPIISCDPAATEKDINDPSGIVVGLGWYAGDQVIVDIVWAEEVWLEIPELVDYLLHLQTHRWPGAPILAESVAGFKGVPQALRRIAWQSEPDELIQVEDVIPQGSKFVRALPAAAAWNAGRIRVPKAASDWDVAYYVKRMQKFTGVVKHRDDLTDATVQLFNHAESELAGATLGAQGGGPRSIAESPF